jgi:hypothetical protein
MFYDVMDIPKNRRISARGIIGGASARERAAGADFAPIFERRESIAQDEQLIDWLRSTVKGLVECFNRTVGEDVLYYTECANFWRLFGRPTEYDADKLLADGLVTVEGLARLVCRLQNEMGVTM